MAKRSRAKLEEIIKRDAPGMTIAKQRAPDAAAPRRAAPDAVSPDLEQIRQKYGVSNKPRNSADAVRVRSARVRADDAVDAGDDSEIVLLEPKGAAADTAWPVQPKAVVVSGDRIIGRQG
jgi:hypothetical protein